MPPISTSDLLVFVSANPPESDATTSGGGIDASGASSAPGIRPTFTQLAANDTITIESDGVDSRLVDITVRKIDGSITTTTGTALTDTTPVTVTFTGGNTIERVLKCTAQTTSATRIVTVKRGGGSTIATIPVNEKGFRLMFYDSSSESTAITRWEKIFWRNNHATLALNNFQVQISADMSPTGKLRQGLATTLNDTQSITDRSPGANPGTPPAGITFVSVGVDQTVAPGTLGATAAIGCWIELALLSNDSPIRSSFTTRLTGTSA
jgi:hypothetical protein